MERAKFYSISDMSLGHNIIVVEDVLRSLDERVDVSFCIDDILEFFNINKFFKNNIYSRDWSEEDKLFYIEQNNKTKRIISKYFRGSYDLYLLFDQISLFEYRSDFFEVLSVYKIYDIIEDEQFEKILSHSKVQIRSILKNKALVLRYDLIIRNKLIENPKNSELILDPEIKKIEKPVLYIFRSL